LDNNAIEMELKITLTFRNKISKLNKNGIVDLVYTSHIAFCTLKGHTIEIRPVTNNQSSLLSSSNNYNRTSHEENEILKPVENKTNIRIPLKREEVEVSRIPYVKEEIVVKKKTVPETRTVTEEIITEKVEDPQV
jgi:hypothetical protein